MVSKETVNVWLKVIKEFMTHIVALMLIVPLVMLLYKSGMNSSIKVPELLISLGSAAVGYYLGRYVNTK